MHYIVVYNNWPVKALQQFSVDYQVITLGFDVVFNAFNDALDAAGGDLMYALEAVPQNLVDEVDELQCFVTEEMLVRLRKIVTDMLEPVRQSIMMHGLFHTTPPHTHYRFLEMLPDHSSVWVPAIFLERKYLTCNSSLLKRHTRNPTYEISPIHTLHR